MPGLSCDRFDRLPPIEAARRGGARLKQLKVYFTDFWHGGGEENIRKNPIYKFLSNHYELVLDAKAPDFLFYSCFGDGYRSYDCIRIFYTGENRRPDFDNADYAFSFDLLDDPRHFRLPLYRFYAEYPEVFKAREPDRVLGSPNGWLQSISG